MLVKYLMCKQSPLLLVLVCDSNRRKFVNLQSDK